MRNCCLASFMAFLLVFDISAQDVSAQQVERFRGSDATGVSADDPRLPDEWTTEQNVRWKVTVPGWGWSSPIVSGHRVFVTSVVNDEEYEETITLNYLKK